MAKAKKLPSGSWRVLYYVGGKPFSVTRPTAKAAELAALEHQLKDKRKASLDNITLSEAIDEYIEAKSNILSPSTISGYRVIQRNSLEDIINFPLKKLTTKILQQQINKNTKRYSPKSVSNQYGLVSAVLKYSNLKLDDITLAPKEKLDYHIPTPEQQQEILKAVEGKGDTELWVMTIMFMGLRPSEAKALRWENYKNGTVLIKGAVVRDEHGEYVYKSQNKTYTSTRKLDVPQVLQEKLLPILKKEGDIFKRTPTAYYKSFKNLTQHINDGKFNIYSLRHAYASTMLLLGVPDKYAMERMGHATTNMLKTVYQHTFQSKQTEYTDKLNEYFETLKKK